MGKLTGEIMGNHWLKIHELKTTRYWYVGFQKPTLTSTKAILRPRKTHLDSEIVLARQSGVVDLSFDCNGSDTEMEDFLDDANYGMNSWRCFLTLFIGPNAKESYVLDSLFYLGASSFSGSRKRISFGSRNITRLF